VTIFRLYTGDDGKSYEEVLEGNVHPYGTPEGEFALPATGVFFLRRDRDTYPSFHNAPRRQYIFVLSGWLEFEVADGNRIHLDPGDVVLVEDTDGQGHITRGVADVAFVHLG
jgi:quercetin dioxygenase-like cupin family protein